MLTKQAIEAAMGKGDIKAVADKIRTDLYKELKEGSITYPEFDDLLQHLYKIYDNVHDNL